MAYYRKVINCLHTFTAESCEKMNLLFRQFASFTIFTKHVPIIYLRFFFSIRLKINKI